ncbi:hypothetical protein GQ473_03970 [archaeon]|nr:hypothetical protein [archaeon]
MEMIHAKTDRILLFLLTFMLSMSMLGGAVSATEYYVKTDGNDGADGLSWANAWQTINHTQANVAVGDGQWRQDNDPTNIEILKDEAINNYGSLKWFYLDDSPEGWGSWHGLFNVVHLASGIYDETSDFIFNPPAWTRWEGAGVDDTTLFTIGWYNNYFQITNDYVVITNGTIGSMYDPTFIVNSSDLAMIDVGIGGSWRGYPTNLLFEDCVLASGAAMIGALEFNYVTDSRFINIPHGLGPTSWINIHGARNRFESVTAYVENTFTLSGDDIVVTGCSGEFTLCGDSGITIDNTTFDDTLVIKKHVGISNIGDLTDNPLHICFDGTYMWVTERRNDKCYQYDQNTGDSLKSWSAPAHEPRGIAWDGSHLWVVCTIGGTICYETDTDGNVLSQFNICGSALTWVDGYLYTYCSNSFYKYDTSGTVVDIYPVDVPATALAYDGTYIWGIQSGVESIINKFSVTGELLESIDTEIYRYITAWFSGIAADTDNHIWIMQDDQGANSHTFLIGDGLQKCTDCDITQVYTEDGATLSHIRTDKKFYDTSAGNAWTTVTSAQTSLKIPANTASTTLTERPFLINTANTIDMLITTWQTSGDYIKKFNASCAAPAATFTYTIGDMPLNTNVRISTNTGWENTHTTDGSGQFTGTYDGGWSEKEFTIELLTGSLIAYNPGGTLYNIVDSGGSISYEGNVTSINYTVWEMASTGSDANVSYNSPVGLEIANITVHSGTVDLWNITSGLASGTQYELYNSTSDLLEFHDALPDGSVNFTTDLVSGSYKVQELYDPQYPSDVNFSVDGNRVYTGTGNLTSSVSMPDFSEELNSYISSCTPDGDGYCDVPLEFEFSDAGNLDISSLSVAYTDGGTKAQALVTSEGLEDTVLKNFWFASTTGNICRLNSEEIPLTVGDMYIGRNTSCTLTCDNFVAVRATTTCGTNDEFTGTPNGC